MSNDLVNALRAAAGIAVSEIAPVKNMDRARWAYISKRACEPLVQGLLENPIVSAMQGQWADLPYSGSLLDFRSAAVYLVDRAIDHDPSEVIADLFQFCSTRTIQLLSVRAIEGLSVTSVIDLGNGFSIVPPHALPQLSETRAVFSPSNTPSHGWGSAPSSAIVLRETFHVPVHSPPTSGVGSVVDRRAIEELMKYVLWAATLASDGAPQLREAYDVVESLGWPGMTCGSIRGGGPFPVWVRPARSVNERLIPDLFSRFRKSPDKLRLAIERLQSSRSRTSFAERAIDLGTCLEILLLRGSKENTEISYKAGTRAAWLLGVNGQHRVAIFKLARELYGARSEAVHSGKAPKFRPGGNEERNFRSYDELCAALVIKIALQDGWPDWTQVVLNSLDGTDADNSVVP